ncbi:MAG: hypothetical protein SGPRY_006985, partial [Prymnesium sp.]
RAVRRGRTSPESMYVAIPQGAGANPRCAALLDLVAAIVAAPGYEVWERAGDLRPGEGRAVALVHSPYVLIKRRDGFLAVRATRQQPGAAMEITLLKRGWDSSKGAETAQVRLRTLGPQEGSADLGILSRYGGAGGGAASSRIRAALKPVTQWVVEATWYDLHTQDGSSDSFSPEHCKLRVDERTHTWYGPASRQNHIVEGALAIWQRLGFGVIRDLLVSPQRNVAIWVIWVTHQQPLRPLLEVKRRGLLQEIRVQRTGDASRGVMPRESVEKLVGRLTHAAIVAPEGSAHLQPLYRARCASHRAIRKSRLHIGCFDRLSRGERELVLCELSTTWIRVKELKITTDASNERLARRGCEPTSLIDPSPRAIPEPTQHHERLGGTGGKGERRSKATSQDPISDGRYLVPVEVVPGDEGYPQMGLTSSPDVDGADEEVVWVGGWVAINTGEPNVDGMRELEMEKGGGVGSARTRRTHRRAHDFLKEINFDESRSEFLKRASSAAGRARSWRKEVAASTASEFESAAVRLNSKLELTTMRLKAEGAAVDASSSESDSSDEEDREQRKRRSALKQPGTGPKRSRHAESADDTDVEDKAEYGKKKSVRHDLRTELKVITPTGVALLLAAAILFKEAGVREAASFAMPTDWDDEEREAEVREEVLERLLQTKQTSSSQKGSVARDLFDAGRAEVQPGAVSANAAERAIVGPAAVAYVRREGGDVRARMRVAPEGMRADLARAVGSNTRVYAADEGATVRTSLPGVVKRMCVALVSAVQKILTRIPTRDDVGLQHLALDAERKLTAAVVAVASQLYRLSEFHDGLLRVDNVLGPTPESTLVDPRHLAIWLRRVMEASLSTHLFRLNPLGIRGVVLALSSPHLVLLDPWRLSALRRCPCLAQGWVCLFPLAAGVVPPLPTVQL